jgi:hypothetical protein
MQARQPSSRLFPVNSVISAVKPLLAPSEPQKHSPQRTQSFTEEFLWWGEMFSQGEEFYLGGMPRA